MSKESPFERRLYVGVDEVRVPPSVLTQPNNAIRDLLPGQWAFGQEHSVNYDVASGRLIVDSFDRMITRADSDVVERNPAVARVTAQIGNRGVLGYVANISGMVNFLDRSTDAQLENLVIDSHRLDDRRRLRGAEILVGLIYRDYGKLGFIGPEELEEQSAEFARQYDEFALSVYEHEGALLVPSLSSEAVDRLYDIKSIEHLSSGSEPDRHNS